MLLTSGNEQLSEQLREAVKTVKTVKTIQIMEKCLDTRRHQRSFGPHELVELVELWGVAFSSRVAPQKTKNRGPVDSRDRGNKLGLRLLVAAQARRQFLSAARRRRAVHGGQAGPAWLGKVHPSCLKKITVA